MEHDWHDYVRLHSNEEGARAAFEHDCEALLKKQFPEQLVGQVRASPGDEGVDVYVGDIGVAPVDVYQCKFFLTAIGNSQRAQIRQSFATAMASQEYSVRSWVLCVPLLDLTLAENKWWAAWKSEQEARYQLPIRLLNGRELIREFKAYGLYATVFQRPEAQQMAALAEQLRELTTRTVNLADAEAFLTHIEQQLLWRYYPRTAQRMLAELGEHLTRYYSQQEALLARHAHLRAVANQESGEAAAARPFARQASQLLPRHAGYAAAAAYTWAEQGDMAQATELARQALAYDPECPQAHAVLAFSQPADLAVVLPTVDPAIARQPAFRATLLELLTEVPRELAARLLSEHLTDFDPPATLTFANRRYWVMAAEILVQLHAVGPVLRHFRLATTEVSPALRRAHDLLVQHSHQLQGTEKLLLAGNTLFLRSLAGYYLTGNQQEFDEYASLFPQFSSRHRQLFGTWWAALLTRWERPAAQVHAVLDLLDAEQDAQLLYLRFVQQQGLGQTAAGQASLRRSLELTDVLEDAAYTRARLYLLLYCPTVTERRAFVTQCRERGQLTAELPAQLLEAYVLQAEESTWPETKRLLGRCVDLMADQPNQMYGYDMAELYYQVREFATSRATQQRLAPPTDRKLRLLWDRLTIRNLYELPEGGEELLQRLAAWRVEQPAERQFCLWELELLDYLGDWARRLEVADYANQAFPEDRYLYWQLLYSLHLHDQHKRLRRELERVAEQPTLLSRQMLFNAVAIARQAGWIGLARTLLYPLARDPQDVVARGEFATLVLRSGDEVIPAPTVAAEGVVVVFTLEGKPRPALLLTAEAIGGNHPFANRLVGLQLGDQFTAPNQVSGRDRPGTVVELLDPHVVLFREISQQVDEQPGDFSLETLHYDADRFEEFERVLSQRFGTQEQSRRARLQVLLREHARGEAAFSAVARGACHDNGLDTYRLLTSAGSAGFYVAPLASYAPVALSPELTYVLDWSTLPLFYQLHEAGLLTLPASLWVSAQVPEFLRELLAEQQRAPDSPINLLISEHHVQPQFFSETYKEDELAFLRRLLDWVTTHCQTQLVREKLDVLREGGRRDSSWLAKDERGYFGSLLDVMYLASRPGTVLVSDDAAVTGLVGQRGSVASSEKYLRTFAADRYAETILPFLLGRRYVGLEVDPHVLYEQFIQAGGRFAGPGLRYLDSLALQVWQQPRAALPPLHQLLRQLYLTDSLSLPHRSLAATTVYLHALRYIVATPSLRQFIRHCITRYFELLPLHQEWLEADFEAAWQQAGAGQLHRLPG